MNVSAHFGRTIGGTSSIIPPLSAWLHSSQANVALVMGSAFGAEGYARMSFATSLQTLEKGFDALERFLRS